MKQRYQTPMSPTWFLQRSGFRKFMLREVTAVFVAGYVIFLIYCLHRLGQGAEGWAAMIETLRSPLSIVLHLIVLAAALYHSITWFNLTPKIMPMYLGEDRVPDVIAAVAMGYMPWVVISAILLWGLMRADGVAG